MKPELSWTEMKKYIGKKYRGIDVRDGGQLTILVVDVTLAGDIVYLWRKYRYTMIQSRFLEFVKDAKET